MTLLTLMDAVQVHAAAAAAAADAKFKDVAVGFGAARGKCVRIFYGGERGPEHFPDDRTLNSQLVGQAIVVRGYWPRSDTVVTRNGSSWLRRPQTEKTSKGPAKSSTSTSSNSRIAAWRVTAGDARRRR